MSSTVQQGPWRTAVEEHSPMVADEGDVYSLLRQARDRYYAAANKLAAKRRDPETDTLPERFRGIVAAYRASGDKVNALIPQEARSVIEIGSEGHAERSEVAGSSQGDQATSVSDDNSQPAGSESVGEGSPVN